MWQFVYVLQAENGERYTGLTQHLHERVAKHNRGEVPHTSKNVPWELEQYFAFRDRKKAAEFERYLKSGSGRAFTKKHF